LLDDGYYDMYKVMKALVEVKFDGIAIPDHIPLVGSSTGGQQGAGPRGGGQEFRPSPGLAYLIGYMLLNAANPLK
jgi:D-mannonate dehydratase